MKRKILCSVAAILIAVMGIAIFSILNRQQRFLDRAFRQLHDGHGSEMMEVIKLKSGHTASVILEHDCCTGAGFNAVAVRTSDGHDFYANKNYCGIEGFYGALGLENSEDLPHFTDFLRAQGFKMK